MLTVDSPTRVTITTDVTATTRKRWVLEVDFPMIRVAHYAEETKKSARARKWSEDTWWSRLSRCRNTPGKKLGALPLVPVDVATSALSHFQGLLGVER